MKKLHLLGSSKTSVAITFDVAIDIWGEVTFNTYANLKQKINIIMPILQHKVHEHPLGSAPAPDQKVIFCPPGPKNKKAIFNHFLKKFNINQNRYETLIHPSAVIAQSTMIDNGALIEPNVIVSSQTKIGFGVNIKRGVNIGHHVTIGDYCDLNPGVITSGNVTIENSVTIGTGAILRDSITIGENTTIGMGSVVTKDIPANCVAYGNPCKVIKQISV